MAKRKKNITKAALIRFQERLKNAPKKEKVAFSPSEAVVESREQIRDALAKGYSYQDIAELLADGDDDSISANTLASYFRAPETDEKPARTKASVKTRRKSDASSKTKNPVPPKPDGEGVADDIPGFDGVETLASDLVSEALAVAPEDMDDPWLDVPADAQKADKRQMQDAFNRMKSSGHRGR